MNSLIIYKSVYKGNTKKIARALKEELDCEMKTPEEIKDLKPSEYDLICFGSGIYIRKHHKSLLKFIDNLPDMKKTKAFIFSTSGLPKIPVIHNFNKKIKKKLERKNLKVIGTFNCRGYEEGPFKLIGGINKGRPNEEDLEKAKEKLRKILDRIDNVKN